MPAATSVEVVLRPVLFVDYAGDTVPVIVDRLTGKTRPAQIFVAVLDASNFTGVYPGAGQGPDPWAEMPAHDGTAILPLGQA